MSEKDVKPGYKTTEFWLTVVAVVLGLLMGSGAVAEDSQVAQIAGWVLAALATLGYQFERGMVKKNGN